MEMEHCRTMRRPDGTRVKIEVRLEEDYLGPRGDFIYKAKVYTCQKGKRTWRSTYNDGDHTYRGLTMKARNKYEHDSMFPTISHDELLEVKRELWLKLEPSLKKPDTQPNR